MKLYQCATWLVAALVGISLNLALITPVAPADATKYQFTQVAVHPLLDELAKCESGGNPNALNPEDGGSPSYGLFQWKIASFYHYNLRYQVVPELVYEDTINHIYNPVTQTLLTNLVLQEQNGWRNWYNCLHKYYK